MSTLRKVNIVYVDKRRVSRIILEMITYAPIFSLIVDSSLWEEEDFVVKVFLTMLAKKNSHHIVIGSAYNIGMWSRKTEKVALEALEVLSSPDTKRLEPQPFEGRRIEKVEGGWLILNGQLYEDIAADIRRRVYQAGWQRKRRAEAREAEKKA